MLTSNTVNSKDPSKNVSKSYTYDNMGRITKTVSNGLTTQIFYDSLGRKSSEKEYEGNSYSIFRGYLYNGVSPYVKEEFTGQYNLLIYSSKTYEYDGEMSVVKVKETGKETVSYTYDKNGNKKYETLANGVISTYTYNKANRITKIENKLGNSNISSYEYTYYLDGSDACKKCGENGIIVETTEYEYDDLKRLTKESVKVGNKISDTYSYEYDDYGNRSKMTATGTENYETVYDYSVNGKYTALLQKETKTVEDNNAVKLNDNVKQTVYTYDKNGNQVKKVADGKTETNTYDGLNQLIGFTNGETTASYKYNASGLRYEKTVDGQTINHVWDGSKQIIADVIDGQFYEADCYIRGTNLIAKYNYKNGQKSEYTYYTQNAHGDVVNLTDSTGKATKKYTYDAFGVEKNIDKNDANAFRYCGEYYDAETATVYLRARYYNPSTGRFISRDSFAGNLGDPLSLNLYTYCANNPVYYSDPTGHIAGVDDAIFFGVAAFICLAGASVLSQPEVQNGLSQSANALTSCIDNIADIFTSSGSSQRRSVKDIFSTNVVTSSSSSQERSLKDIFSSTSQDSYRSKWIDDSLTTGEDWTKNWRRKDAITKDDADSIGKSIDIPYLPMKPPVFFPLNPNDFNPARMTKYSYNQGKIIKWCNTEKKAIFEWDEDEKYGDHYHCMFPEWNNKHSESGKAKDVVHYYAGQIVPEPWASWYRGY